MKTDSRAIIYTSPPAPVSMGDQWFETANPEHFWIRRRFAVLERMAGPLIRDARALAEIGCGNGLVQKAIEDRYGKTVAGFDLNELALKKNISVDSPCYCYDVHLRAKEFRGRFDVVLLLDVLEHISDQDAFLQSVKYHLAPGGYLIVNVPALMALYSKYDKAVGHVRRYAPGELKDVLTRNGLPVRSWTYWGAGLTPLLALRKAVLAVRGTNENELISTGFNPGPQIINYGLGLLSSCEPIPQTAVGASLMAVAQTVTEAY